MDLKGPWEAGIASAYRDGKRALVEYFVRRLEDDVAIASDIIDPDTCLPSEEFARVIASIPDIHKVCARISGKLCDTADSLDTLDSEDAFILQSVGDALRAYASELRGVTK